MPVVTRSQARAAAAQAAQVKVPEPAAITVTKPRVVVWSKAELKLKADILGYIKECEIASSRQVRKYIMTKFMNFMLTAECSIVVNKSPLLRETLIQKAQEFIQDIQLFDDYENTPLKEACNKVLVKYA